MVTSKFTSKSLSRNVSSKCEPILLAIACIVIECERVGNSLTLRFLLNIVVGIQKRHLRNRMKDTSNNNP